jgi:hypothetical protein
VWTPPGLDRDAWRLALAEDLLDVLAILDAVETAIAVEAKESGWLSRVGWPGVRGYGVASLNPSTVFATITRDGFEQAVLLAADAPDLPGMLIAKLLRPLTTRPLAAAPAVGGDAGLLGLAARLPAPAWLPGVGLDELTPPGLRRLAPRPTDVAVAPGWHRLRAPEDLARLDPRLEGWDATRTILGGQDRPFSA